MTGCDCKLGYRGPTACAAADITYRQLDYWARTGLVEPSIRSANGSGSQRLYCFHDILLLRSVRRLLQAGLSLQGVRAAIATLRDSGISDSTGLVLLSDGVDVWVVEDEQIAVLLQQGRAVFAIAMQPLHDDVTARLGSEPAETALFGVV